MSNVGVEGVLFSDGGVGLAVYSVKDRLFSLGVSGVRGVRVPLTSGSSSAIANNSYKALLWSLN